MVACFSHRYSCDSGKKAESPAILCRTPPLPITLARYLAPVFHLKRGDELSHINCACLSEQNRRAGTFLPRVQAHYICPGQIVWLDYMCSQSTTSDISGPPPARVPVWRGSNPQQKGLCRPQRDLLSTLPSVPPFWPDVVLKP
ncbi:hypothetical protein PoB_003434800 [Plakobranchus ocellatus]|uniref:LysM domain-containing protein n=1 Tax=Plakobranchus ocellatus TaxID=259542 RepID=A0AAV4AMP6_9GAST|nr:hypothetical protein PoB_003434800 [Plakobranchus ocellatus]